jgi:hypothetical protein
MPRWLTAGRMLYARVALVPRCAHRATPQAALAATVRRGPGDGIMPPAAGLRPVEL